MSAFPNIKPFGNQALLLEWKQEISDEVHQQVMLYKKTIDVAFCSKLIETVPTYCSLAVYLKEEINQADFILELQSITFPTDEKPKEQRLIYIPVCYALEFGWDLEEMAQQLNRSIDEIIRLHTAPEYLVYFLGFLPGFPYLGGLDSRIAFPRKATPRQKVFQGSVGIAGSQTGIYTIDSPGGWNLIGRSPLRFFDVTQESPFLLAPDDFVRFYAISRKRFDEIEEEVAQKTYQIRTEVKRV